MQHEDLPALPYPLPDGQLDALFARLRQVHARYLDWAEYWYSDEPHQGEFALYDAVLRPIEPLLTPDLPSLAGGVPWYLAHAFDHSPTGSYGYYRLDAIERTVTQIGRANYQVVVTPIPEPEQERSILVPALPRQESIEAEVAWGYYRPEAVDEDGLDRFFAVLAEREVVRVEWVTYWHEGNPHLDDYTLFDVTGASLSPTIDVAIHNYWGSREGQARQALTQTGAPDVHPVLWLASHAFSNPYGHFRLAAPDREIHKVGDARFTVRKDPWPEEARPSFRV